MDKKDLEKGTIAEVSGEIKKDEDMNKGFKDPAMAAQALNDAHKATLLNKPAIKAPHVNTLPSPEEHAARASMYDDFMPQGKFNTFGKGEECLKFDQNGQWSLTNKTESCSKCGKVPCEC